MTTAPTDPRSIPLRAIPLALGALAVPGVAAVVAPEWLSDEAGLLLWLTPILPAFLLAYYRGWRGAAAALAFGMVSLTGANLVLVITGLEPPGWPLMLVIVVVYILFTQGVAALTELLERERREAQRLASTDGLTGLPNRRQGTLFLDLSFEGARRGGALSVALFDLDQFKRVNDTFGHAVGDAVIKAFGNVLRQETRGSDLSMRFGGEEFLAVLPGSKVGSAEALAERVRRRLTDIDLPCGPVTVSVGVAAYTEGTASPELLVAAADRALYAAKEQGRDRVVSAAELQPRPSEGAPGDVGMGQQVLVVDDDLEVEASLSRTLANMGFAASAAGGPRGALDHFARGDQSIGVLIVDVVMPEMSGPTLVASLAERGWKPKVVYMSGYTRGEVSDGVLPDGRAPFIEKPVDLARLEELLESLGTSREPQRRAS